MERILVTSVSTTKAWERVGWYKRRWIVEEDHQCLKTGCRLEERQVQSADRMIRLPGFSPPLAARLLCLWDLARRKPERPVQEILEGDLLAIMAAQAGQSPTQMTTRARLSSYCLIRARPWPLQLPSSLVRSEKIRTRRG